MRGHLILALLFLAVSASAQGQDGVDLRLQRGRQIAMQMCSPCHAIDRSSSSPLTGAPTFRTFDQRFDLDSFIDRLQQGLTSGHQDIPTFRFTRDDARALITYLRSLQNG